MSEGTTGQNGKPRRAVLRSVSDAFQYLGEIGWRRFPGQRMVGQASHDPLTGLPNRTLFLDRLVHTLEVAERNRKRAAMMFLDLDGFKNVNDTLGHAGGDSLLRETGRRIRSVLRRSDTVARVGGDEFTIILPNLDRAMESVPAATKILRELSLPFSIDGQEIQVSASIGITVYPADGDNAETLLMNADMAMYRAKEGGKNNYRFYTAQMDLEARERQRLERELRLAVERNEFELFYQPVVDLRTRDVTGAEALLRWRHPLHGMLLPSEFLPLAEETGLIVPIGDLTLRQACTEARSWIDAGLPRLDLGVNLSRKQCLGETARNSVGNALRESGLPPGRLTVEIHEAALGEDPDTLGPVITKLANLGVRICVDDFGTGYTSLRSLEGHAIDMLKVDRSFLSESIGRTGLATAIIALGQGLGMDVEGEGVESIDQARFLRTRGCHRAQGNLFCEPLPASEFREFVAHSVSARRYVI